MNMTTWDGLTRGWPINWDHMLCIVHDVAHKMIYCPRDRRITEKVDLDSLALLHADNVPTGGVMSYKWEEIVNPRLWLRDYTIEIVNDYEILSRLHHLLGYPPDQWIIQLGNIMLTDLHPNFPSSRCFLPLGFESGDRSLSRVQVMFPNKVVASTNLKSVIWFGSVVSKPLPEGVEYDPDRKIQKWQMESGREIKRAMESYQHWLGRQGGSYE